MVKAQQIEDTKRRSTRFHPIMTIAILILAFIALILGLMLSISVGAADIRLQTVWEAIIHYDPDLTQHQIIYELRIPRALVGAMVGASLAVAGSIMQGMTRNPLASPSIMGVNAGSAFAIAMVYAFWPSLSYSYTLAGSFAGAAFGVGVVYGIGSMAKGGLTPVRLALSGIAVSALLGSLSSGLSIYYQTGQDLSYWYAGGISGAQWTHVEILFPWVLSGLLGSVILSRSITVLSLGEETSIGLGQRTGQVKVMGSLMVLILAGAAVSAAGPIGFIGLIVPHVTRFLVGLDYRWIIPCSAVLGALFVVFADIGTRLINPPYETPIGVITSLFGIPLFLYLVRQDRRGL